MEHDAKYKQLKVSLNPEIVSAFKNACAAAGVSMASEMSSFMSYRTGILKASADKEIKKNSLDARGKRRHQVKLIIDRLEAIKSYEEAYQNNIPDNLQSGQAFENSGQSIELLEQAIDLLLEAY